MEHRYHVAVLVGSLRRDSLNLRLANALADLAPDTLKLDFVQIGDLPLYNPDLDDDVPPAPWVRFRDGIRASNAILFVTPEYNRSIPAALKNALDVGSRPMAKASGTVNPLRLRPALLEASAASAPTIF